MIAVRSRAMASAAVVGFAVLAAWEGGLRAEARHQPVVVEVEQCEQSLAVEIRRIVGVELRATVVDAVPAGESVTRVLAACRDSEVDLSLEDAVTAKRLVRTVALAEAAEAARARLIALAVAELVVASWQEIQGDAEQTGPALPPSRPQAAAASGTGGGAGQGEVRAMVEAIGVVRALPGEGLWLLGAGARGFVTISRPLTLTLDVTVEWGAASRATGQVAARAMGGALGLGWGMERRWAFIMPWLGARAGAVRLTGEPNPDATTTSGQTQSGPFLGPEIGVAATFFPHAMVHATLALSAGVILLGVRGEVFGDSNVNARGPWVALVVGVGLAQP
jgi:hypothetical protein